MTVRNGLACCVLGVAFAAATLPAWADDAPDACRKAPTRTCVLEAAGIAADAVTDPYAKASYLLAVSARQQRAGQEAESAATLARADEAIKQIPPNNEFGVPPPGLVAVRAAKGDMDGAIALARSYDKPMARVYGLAAVGAAMQRQGRAEDAKAYYAEAIAAVQGAPNDKRAFLLVGVARGQTDVGSPDAANTFDLAVAAAKATGSAGALSPILSERIRAGEYARAYLDVMDLPEDGRDFHLLALVTRWANAGHIDEALTIARSINTDFYRVTAYTNLATADFRAGQPMAGAEMLIAAQQEAARESVPALKAEALAAEAGAEAVGGMSLRSNAHLDEARKALATESSDTFRRSLAEAIARALIRAGSTQDGIEMLRAHLEPRNQSAMLNDASFDLIAAGRNGDAYAVLAAIPIDRSRIGALLEFADKLPK